MNGGQNPQSPSTRNMPTIIHYVGFSGAFNKKN